MSQVVLVGAGHAHLYVALRAAQFRAHGAQLTLIDPGFFWYSGLATGIVSGMYAAEDGQLDVERLITRQGGKFIRDEVARLDRATRMVHLRSGRSLRYDWLSLNLGSEVRADSWAVGQDHVWSVKPISRLWQLRVALQRQLAAKAHLRILVVGGGATGAEIAANLMGLAERLQARLDLTVVTSRSRLLQDHPSGAAASVARNLQRRGVRLIYDTRIVGRQDRILLTAHGQQLAFDHVVLAAGLRATTLAQGSELPADPIDGFRVGPTLQSVADPHVFAAGDCMSFSPRRLPKLGVFGVRAAPVLHHNLLASVDGRALKPYRPQGRYLSILNLGDAAALATWGPFWWRGRASQVLKHWIDQRFLAQYRGTAT